MFIVEGLGLAQLNIIKVSCLHSEEAVNRDKGTPQRDEHTEQHHAATNDGKYWHGEKVAHLWLMTQQQIDASSDHPIGQKSGGYANTQIACQEGTTDEAPAGSDQLHRMQQETLRIDGEFNRVVDEGKGDE